MNSVEQLETQQCRTCYNSLSDLQLLTTFPASCSGQVEMKTYATLLNEVCNINVMEDTGIWPQFICSACSQKLLTAYDFIQQTVKTDKHLRLITNRMQIKNEIDFIEKPELDIPLEVKIEEFDTGNEREFQYSPIEPQLIKSELIMATDQQHEDTTSSNLDPTEYQNEFTETTTYSQLSIIEAAKKQQEIYNNLHNSQNETDSKKSFHDANTQTYLPLTCDECKIDFNKPTCHLCSRNFARPYHLRRHMINIHGRHIVTPKSQVTIKDGRFQCGQCERSYSRRTLLYNHEREKHNE